MKAAGKQTKDTAKAPIGLPTQKTSFEDSTQATGNPIKNKEEEPCSTSLAIVMTVCGWTTCPMVREE
jgi:hypothetical protein